MGRFPMGGLALFGAVLIVAGGLGLAAQPLVTFAGVAAHWPAQGAR